MRCVKMGRGVMARSGVIVGCGEDGGESEVREYGIGRF